MKKESKKDIDRKIKAYECALKECYRRKKELHKSNKLHKLHKLHKLRISKQKKRKEEL